MTETEAESELFDAEMLVDELEDYLDHKIHEASNAHNLSAAFSYIDVKDFLLLRRRYWLGR